jgi:SAM-dependent methyltransferase/8-oxo-dGTP pyrophosphatase MutT (NUDIX family)
VDLKGIDAAIAGYRAPNRADYPELAGYSRDEIYRDCSGGGALYLAARMARTLRLRPADVVLDLGCGKGETSLFLVRHLGVRVVAVDLWTSATYLNAKFCARGARDRIVPINLDVTGRLPFADGYFDAVFCMNSFSFYGGSIGFLHHLLRTLKPGGQLCIGSEVLSDEFTPEQLENPPDVYSFRMLPPNEGVDVFEDDFTKQHTPQWWRDLFERSGLLEVQTCTELEDADVLYEDLARYEHESQVDPFDAEILVRQIEWGRQYRPRKSLFVLTARRTEKATDDPVPPAACGEPGRMVDLLQKVAAFVVRQAPGGPELLLFEHPYAGVQLPAGTVDEGETPEAAVLREVAEETGLARLTVSRHLGSAPAGLPGDYRGVCQQATIYARPDAGSFDWAYVPRGAAVRLLGRRTDGFAHIRYEEYDSEPERHYLTYSLTGWVRDEALAEAVIRHFYLLDFQGESPARWTIEADNHTFTCFWAPLSDLPALVPYQQRWLGFLPEQAIGAL